MTALRHDKPFGLSGLSPVDRFGTWLSVRAVMRHLPRQGRLAVLDLGCGYQARLLRLISGRLAQGVGVDMKIAEEAKALPGLSFLEAPLEEALPGLPSDSQDAVFLLSVLEHLNDPLWALEHCLRLTRPGGVFMINVPTWLGKRFLEFSAFRLGLSGAFEIEDHKTYYNIPSLWPLLVRAGWKPSRIRLYYHKFGLNLFGLCRK